MVQTEDFANANELFNDEYSYFSSYSKSWLTHSKSYLKNVKERFCLNKNSYVIEIAANDGYLLQFAKKMKIPCLGIEPTKKAANIARKKGIKIIEKFFGSNLAKHLIEKEKQADLL